MCKGNGAVVVVYLHGIEKGTKGEKGRYLRRHFPPAEVAGEGEGVVVVTPDMHVSCYDLRKRHCVLRVALRVLTPTVVSSILPELGWVVVAGLLYLACYVFQAACYAVLPPRFALLASMAVLFWSFTRVVCTAFTECVGVCAAEAREAVERAVDAVRGESARPVRLVLIGASFGGAAALRLLQDADTTGDPPSVDRGYKLSFGDVTGVLLIAPALSARGALGRTFFPVMPLEPGMMRRLLRVPNVVVFHGSADSTVPAHASERLLRALAVEEAAVEAKNGGVVEMLVFEGGDHKMNKFLLDDNAKCGLSERRAGHGVRGVVLHRLGGPTAERIAPDGVPQLAEVVSKMAGRTLAQPFSFRDDILRPSGAGLVPKHH
eukprot:Hpha_TRINITY_DN8989_c0_g1::TRINITY_DN8989_c0_g1_i1::g.80754::m.80754